MKQLLALCLAAAVPASAHASGFDFPLHTLVLLYALEYPGAALVVLGVLIALVAVLIRRKKSKR